MEVFSYAPLGYLGQLVAVEVDVRTGIPGTDIIGLPASEVREARERVRVAVRNSGFEYPSKRILVNLAPADVPKSGNGFDLAIAVSIIVQTGQLAEGDVAKLLVFGELHLDGTVSGIRGGIAAVDEARKAGIDHFLVPLANQGEALAVAHGRIAVMSRLADLRRLVFKLGEAGGAAGPRHVKRPPVPRPARPCGSGDYVHMRGNAVYKRALILAAAGGHNLMVVGPPGVGKSMGISLLPTILDPLDRTEALEVTRIHSMAGEPVPDGGLIQCRPVRSPHHNSSVEGLLGGGRSGQPGEVSLAHRGILFLDEALEFRRPALQGLREPLERGYVHVSRAGRTLWFPARFQLVIAANPCPCGNLGRPERRCLCSLSEVERYWRRLGGPLLDRVDIRVSLPLLEFNLLPAGDTSADMRLTVQRARRRREVRTSGRRHVRNADLSVHAPRDLLNMQRSAQVTYAKACGSLRLSGRASAAVARVARTIADVEDSDEIIEEHVLEAIAHRRRGEDSPLWSVG